VVCYTRVKPIPKQPPRTKAMTGFLHLAKAIVIAIVWSTAISLRVAKVLAWSLPNANIYDKSMPEEK